MIESTLVLGTVILPFYPDQHISPHSAWEYAMSNIMYILVTHLCINKKKISYVSYILQRAVMDMEKQVRVKYRVSGSSKTPSENTHISDETIHWHKCVAYSKQVNKFAWIFHRSNILRIVNMVFEVDKYHNWSNTSLVGTERIPYFRVRSKQVPIPVLSLQYAQV